MKLKTDNTELTDVILKNCNLSNAILTSAN
ncbi:pentapeptide repeat-containing protein, partial [Bacillus safensis]|nr:pentapeptide repeat-containing protein [Bacillus safensis]